MSQRAKVGETLTMHVCVSVCFNRFNVSPLHTEEGRRSARKLCVLTCVDKVDLKDISLSRLCYYVYIYEVICNVYIYILHIKCKIVLSVMSIRLLFVKSEGRVLSQHINQIKKNNIQ